MTDGHVFGSGDLRPEMVRAARFPELANGGYDPAAVQAFLENVASALEVLASSDPEQALRAEFRRNAEIAQQVLDAGQAAAEQLRRQAADDARRILEETRESATQLQEAVRADIEASRSKVEDVRAQFISDLRDLYDRIGASLYRFERAAAEGPGSGIPEAPAALEPVEPAPVESAPATGEVAGDWHVLDEPAPAASQDVAEVALPPAYEQLPPEAYIADANDAAHHDPFAVEEDEPLAPGEPLVDLSGMHDAPVETAGHSASPWADAGAAAPAEPPGEPDGPSGFQAPGWLDTPIAEPGTYAPVDETPTDPAPAAGGWLDEGDQQSAVGAAGSWLDAPAEAPAAPSPETEVDPTADDARAEALLAGMGQLVDESGGAVPMHPIDPSEAAQGVAAPPAEPAASGDALAVRQLILEAISQGQSRETVEAYLRDQLGFVEPAALVDAALQGSA